MMIQELKVRRQIIRKDVKIRQGLEIKILTLSLFFENLIESHTTGFHSLRI